MDSLTIGTNYGSVADWVAAGSAFFALAFLAYERILAGRRSIQNQASHVSAWFTGFPDNNEFANISLLNKSSEPVFEVVITVVSFQGGGIREGNDANELYSGRLFKGVLPPSTYADKIRFDGKG
jgi:hypothetical protein